MPGPHYRHTQIGWVTLGVSLFLVPFLIFAVARGEIEAVLIPLGIIAVVVLLFGTLTVDIDDTRLLIRFGIGLIRKTIRLNKIRAYAPVRNNWYYGWGIRVTPYGMLYNVSGLSTVELLLDGGRRVRVGTDEPEALIRAFQTATRIPQAPSVAEFPKDLSWRRRARLIGGITGALIALWVMWMFYTNIQPPAVTMTANNFAVSSGWYSREVPFSDITSVALVDELPRILRRTNGFAAGGILRGNFRLDQWGSGQLYINRGAPPYVVVRTRNTFVVVNFENPVRTRELYESMRVLARSPEPEAGNLKP